ncbi:MAG: hypothetical protein CMI33_06880 [Opitutales bacterium]|nr:hypothetical protein [Opitutales bacterium]
MIKTAHLLTFLFFLNSFAHGQATTQEKPDYHLGFRIAPRISTLGGGLEFAKGLTPSFGLRGGFNYFTYGYDATESDVEYNLDLELKSLGLFADWHPFKGSFRLSGGFLINGNGIEGKAKPTTANFEIGDGTYALNSASLEISYNTFAPYFGLGWDTTFGDEDNWGFCFDLGLVYSGSPEASLIVDPTAGMTAALTADVKKEEADLQESLDDFEWWPVLSAGLVYQF